jgi:hypothetical protein
MAPVDEIQHHAWLAKEAMQRASADLLRGFTIYADGWDKDVLIHPQHYTDPRGQSIWRKLAPILGLDPLNSLQAQTFKASRG